MIEAAYRAGAKRYFFSSSACAYKVELLGTGTLTFTRDASGLVVTLPEKKPNDYAYTLKITPKT